MVVYASEIIGRRTGKWCGGCWIAFDGTVLDPSAKRREFGVGEARIVFPVKACLAVVVIDGVP